MGNWGYNPTYRGPITPFITSRGPTLQVPKMEDFTFFFSKDYK